MNTLSKTFIKALIAELSEYISDKCDEVTDDISSSLREIKSVDSHTCKYDNGATKGVLIFDDLDVVIKIPFQGCSGYYYTSESTDAEEKSSFEAFQGATVDDNPSGWDYCKRETELYEKARKAGVEEFFLEEEKLCEVNGYPIYVQKKAHSIGYESMESKEIAAMRERIDNLLEKVDTMRMSGNFITQLAVAYTFDKLCEFFDFCKEQGITDLHSSNYGYYNNKPIIVDYSGYYES